MPPQKSNLLATLEALKRKEANRESTQGSIAIPPSTQTNTQYNNNNDDLDALLDAIDEHVQLPASKLPKLIGNVIEHSDAVNSVCSNNDLLADISTDNVFDLQAISETDIVECKSITSPSGFDIASQHDPFISNNNNHKQSKQSPLTEVKLANESGPQSLPFPISLQEDEIKIDLIERNTRAICGSIQTWSQSTQDYIKVPQSLVFITRHQMIGSMYKLSLIDASNIPFEGTAQAHIFEKIKPHYGMALKISDFTLLFNFAPKPHAIITSRNVDSIHTNIHSVDDD